MEMRLSKRIVAAFTCIILLVAAVSVGAQTVYAASKPAGTTIKSISAVNSNSISLKWSTVKKNCSGYEIYRSTKSGGGYEKIKEIINKKTSKYKDTNLERYTTYYYKVRAFYKYNAAVTQYFNTTTQAWVNEKPNPEDWTGEQTQEMKVEKILYGKFSKVKSAKTKKTVIKQTQYASYAEGCIDLGSTIICTEGWRIYFIDKKALNVYSADWPDYIHITAPKVPDPAERWIRNLYLKDNYLYFLVFCDDYNSIICREDINKKTVEKLTSTDEYLDYLVTEDKVYYKRWNGKKYVVESINLLNNEIKKESGYSIKINRKNSNTKKYSVRSHGVYTTDGYNEEYNIQGPSETEACHLSSLSERFR